MEEEWNSHEREMEEEQNAHHQEMEEERAAHDQELDSMLRQSERCLIQAQHSTITMMAALVTGGVLHPR